MAHIIGALTSSHIPSIGNAISGGKQNEPYWKEFFDGYKPVHQWLQEQRPDVAVVIYNDHGLNFFLNNLPTFAVGAASEYITKDEGWGLPVFPPYRGYPEMSWHVIESLIDQEFDIAMCQEMAMDHAFINPMRLFWPNENPPAIKTIPVAINTVQFPLPRPARCYALGKAIANAVASWPTDEKVVVIGTGGMSHQLDGERAGFINKKFDEMCMEALLNEPEKLAKFSSLDLVREAGAQGAEIIMWLAARGALQGRVSKIHSSYHIPISNTAAGVLALANQ
ncbi:MAG TPA: class III extradiol dioxygenase family protein [Candidatus Acidoferrum sp.]|nr:class III extradiol dioxygenase family protein [Candidatus Acidoferrum sp.]